MRGVRVHLDFGRQLSGGESLLQLSGSPLIVICGDRDEELRLRLRGLQVRTARLILTSPPSWNDATAPTRSDAAAVRNAIGPPMQ